MEKKDNCIQEFIIFACPLSQSVEMFPSPGSINMLLADGWYCAMILLCLALQTAFERWYAGADAWLVCFGCWLVSVIKFVEQATFTVLMHGEFHNLLSCMPLDFDTDVSFRGYYRDFTGFQSLQRHFYCSWALQLKSLGSDWCLLKILTTPWH